MFPSPKPGTSKDELKRLYDESLEAIDAMHLYLAIICQQPKEIWAITESTNVCLNEKYHDKYLIEYAVETGNIECVELLIRAGARVFGLGFKSHMLLTAGSDLKMVKLLHHYGAFVEEADKLGSTALLQACKNGWTDVVMFLLHNHRNPNHTDIFGQSCLHHAIQEEHVGVVALLMEQKDINPVFEDYKKKTPFFYCIKTLNQECFAMLYETGQYPGYQYDVVMYGFTKGLKYILDKGIGIDEKDSNGWTMLHYSVLFGRVDCVELLVNSGVDKSILNDKGEKAIDIVPMICPTAERIRNLLDSP